MHKKIKINQISVNREEGGGRGSKLSPTISTFSIYSKKEGLKLVSTFISTDFIWQYVKNDLISCEKYGKFAPKIRKFMRLVVRTVLLLINDQRNEINPLKLWLKDE